MNFRIKPFSVGKYLVENHHDMDIIMSSEINKIINGLDLEISIEKNKKIKNLLTIQLIFIKILIEQTSKLF